ncbi:MAG: MerR family transcriptional regulator [Chitinophaga sp.]|jgi:MerR family transcriptional regulator, light-induced transcriptional regulator|nr:MerR family transcriptional regulator [Chitinophaga sp.]
MEESFSIKDLENLTGIKAHTIRIWEQRYSFLKPNRTDTNIRHYSAEELKAILNIALLNKNGFKISHIDRMSEDEIKNKILSLQSPEAQLERIVNSLIQSMVDLDVQSFEKNIDDFLSINGVESTVMKIIFPFLERVGLLWLTNNIIPAQEHIVSNIIRQKLVLGLEKFKHPVTQKNTVILFLPENEYHELGLLFVYYLFKKQGLNILYLGANVPVKDLIYVVEKVKPHSLYTHLTSASGGFNLERFIQNFSQLLPNQQLVISGFLSQSYKKAAPANIKFKTSLAQVLEFAHHF